MCLSAERVEGRKLYHGLHHFHPLDMVQVHWMGQTKITSKTPVAYQLCFCSFSGFAVREDVPGGGWNGY